MDTILIANIFSFIWAVFLWISTFSKQRKNMLGIQVADCFFNAVACLFAGSYSGFTTNLISGVRNLLNIKGKMTNFLLIIICVTILVVGFYFNKSWWIWFLPPIACVQYTICSSLTKSAQKTRIALLINIMIWLVHDGCMMLYPVFIMDFVIICVTSFNIFRVKRTFSHK
jgi:hypothetical protein